MFGFLIFVFVFCSGVVALAVSAGLYWRLLAVINRVDRLERSLAESKERTLEVLPVSQGPKPLYGLRIALDIKQDHSYPVFAEMLKELLLKEDVAEVMIGSMLSDEADIRIAGSLTCNGYADVYYQADLSCRTRSEAICTVMEKPSGGDRPENLALELVTTLSKRLDVLVRRDERRKAINELRED